MEGNKVSSSQYPRAGVLGDHCHSGRSQQGCHRANVSAPPEPAYVRQGDESGMVRDTSEQVAGLSWLASGHLGFGVI